MTDRAALAGIGPFFELQVSDASDPTTVPLRALVEDRIALGRLVESVAGRLGTTDPVIAASILQQGWAARVTSILTGSWALGLSAPDLAAANLRCRPGVAPGQLVLVGDAELDRETSWRRAADDHLALLHRTLRTLCPIGDRLLWGNVAAAWAGSLTVLAAQGRLDVREDDRRMWPIPDDLSELGHWYPARPTPRFRRSTCCLYERLPGAGRCGDCSLDR